MLRDVIFSLSLANLCFIRAWSRLFVFSHAKNTYFLSEPPRTANYAAVVLDTLLLAVLFWAVLLLLRRRSDWRLLRGLAEWIFLLLLLIPLRTLHETLVALGLGWLRPLSLPWALFIGERRLFAALSIGFWVLVLLGLVLWRVRVVRVLRLGVSFFFPLALLTFAQTLWLAGSSARIAHGEDQGLVPHTARPRQVDESLPKVVWLIFDQLDYELTFVARPAGVALPALDRLRASALNATQALPPRSVTLSSLPSLLCGRLVTKARPVRTGLLHVELEGEPGLRDWREIPNVFREVHQLRGTTSLYGWYHPYCQVLGADLDECLWMPWVNLPRESLGGWMGRIGRSLVDDRFEEMSVAATGEHHLEKFLQMRNRVLFRIAHLEPGLVFVHWPIPHAPFIYDRSSGRFDTSGTRGYADNLVLADRTLAEVVDVLEREGEWTEVNLIVSSDHCRMEKSPSGSLQDRRIPLLVKLAGGVAPVEYDKPLNSVITKDLVLALLQREIHDNSALVVWLDRHGGTRAPVGLAKEDQQAASE